VVRLSALMELPVIMIFTHDSIGVGEDGPTHQPIEQLLSLRSIPGMIVLRPADANEVAEAWRLMVTRKHQPVCLIVTRQPVPTFDRKQCAAASGLARGAYILADPQDGEPEVILIGTGSEVQLCMSAHEMLQKDGIRSRVVSMPSWEIFEQQDAAYRESVLPDKINARVAVEQASVIGWDRYAGRHGAIIGMKTFGASAPLKDLLVKFGFSPQAVADAARKQLGRE
jgi:transketolase